MEEKRVRVLFNLCNKTLLSAVYSLRFISLCLDGIGLINNLADFKIFMLFGFNLSSFCLCFHVER